MAERNNNGRGDGGRSGQQAADSLSRIGQVFATPSQRFGSGGGGGAGGGFDWSSILDWISPGRSAGGGAPRAGGELSQAARKLPRRQGNQAAQAWESLAPIPARVPGNCTGGIEDKGVILFVHDAETSIDLHDYGLYSDATAWMLVHTVSDLIEGLRAYVGTCGCVRGIMVDAHGGYAGSGGFRLGDDDDGDGHVEPSEANDMVSTAAQAATFGNIIKNAFCSGNDTFFSVAACSSAGTSNAFLTAINTAAGVAAIGAPGSVRTGGNWLQRSWWEADGGRVQINRDGTSRTSATESGNGIWRPF
jgi:hypothetical protein